MYVFCGGRGFWAVVVLFFGVCFFFVFFFLFAVFLCVSECHDQWYILLLWNLAYAAARVRIHNRLFGEVR